MAKANGSPAREAIAGSSFKTASVVPDYAQEFVQEELVKFRALEADLASRHRSEDEAEAENEESRLEHARRSVQRLTWLSNDDRMTEVYAILNKEFNGKYRESQWYRFIVACIDADDDHSYERSVLEYGRVLRREIHETADKLFELLGDLESAAGEYGDREANRILDWPHGLFCMRMRQHVPEKRYRYRNMGLHRYHLWRHLRPVESEMFKRRETMLRPRDVVGEIVKQAQKWEPWPGAAQGAAEVVLRSQKRLPKTQLIRSFWYYLTWRRYNPWDLTWQRTVPMLKAIAQTCTVLLDSPDEVVTYADVKASLKIFDQEAQ